MPRPTPHETPVVTAGEPDQDSKPVRPECLADVVDAYIERYGMKKAQELAFYANQPSLRAVVDVAARFQAPSGNCQSRQSRIPRDSKEAVRELLSVEAIGEPSSFAELEQVLQDRIGSVRGVGDRTVYDTALRIGAYLGLLPKNVYLHGGTRDGAAALEVDASGRMLAPEELPEVFRVLDPWELEDCLGLFKDDLERIRATGGHGRRSV